MLQNLPLKLRFPQNEVSSKLRRRRGVDDEVYRTAEEQTTRLIELRNTVTEERMHRKDTHETSFSSFSFPSIKVSNIFNSIVDFIIKNN